MSDDTHVPWCRCKECLPNGGETSAVRSFPPMPEGLLYGGAIGGGTHISPVMPKCTVIPAVRVCHRCDAPCTADDKTCPNCGAPEDNGERESNSAS